MKIRAVAVLATLAASICQRLPAQSRAGKVTERSAPCPCRTRKPEPLMKQEAKQLLTRLPYVSQDRLRGIRDHFGFDQRVNVWYTFRLTHSPNTEQGLRIDGYEAVNTYTADIEDPILLCKAEATTPKLRSLQRALRRSHCLGTAILKKYRNEKRFPCLE